MPKMIKKEQKFERAAEPVKIPGKEPTPTQEEDTIFDSIINENTENRADAGKIQVINAVNVPEKLSFPVEVITPEILDETPAPSLSPGVNLESASLPDKSSSPLPLPYRLERDPLTGLLHGINYNYNEDGSINWRAMVSEKYIVLNRDKFKDVDLSTINPAEQDDSKLIILLAGFKELAFLRGFHSVTYNVYSSTEASASVSCKIEWAQNFETGNRPVTFESLASANFENTKGFGQNFLLTVAENRAFARCVRNFLRIHVVCSDELSGKISPEENEETNSHIKVDNTQIVFLEDLLNKSGVTFKTIKDRLIKEGNQEASNWNSIYDLSPEQLLKITTRLKNKMAESKAK